MRSWKGHRYENNQIVVHDSFDSFFLIFVEQEVLPIMTTLENLIENPDEWEVRGLRRFLGLSFLIEHF